MPLSGHPELEVYPRVCGGTMTGQGAAIAYQGLSPRVRGNLSPTPSGREADRSIPACAGEPAPGTHRTHLGWVYPRVCGGTSSTTTRVAGNVGLSPRVRGNQVRESAC